MKPTCPAACSLKEAMNQHKESQAQTEEFRMALEQFSPAKLRKILVHATFLYYRQQGFGKFSTWVEMAERRRVLYFIWGAFERLDHGGGQEVK